MMLAVLGSLGWLAATLAVGQAQAPATTQPQTQDGPVMEGLWPTERMIESMIRRWALEAADTYELDDGQHRQVEATMLERGTRMLRENRRELQPLVNEFFEARLALGPPSQEQVQGWAARALPVFGRIREEIEAANDDIRPLLSPAQRARFEAEALKMTLGLEGMQRQIAEWERGQFAVRDWWDPPPKRAAPPTSQPVMTRGDIEVPDQITIELEAWDQYVANFIEANQLDQAQRAAALSFLQEVKERARVHRERHRDELFDLEQRIASPQGKEAGDVAQALESVYGPVDSLFRELSERLSRLPTQTQRTAASQPAR